MGRRNGVVSRRLGTTLNAWWSYVVRSHVTKGMLERREPLGKIACEVLALLSGRETVLLAVRRPIFSIRASYILRRHIQMREGASTMHGGITGSTQLASDQLTIETS